MDMRDIKTFFETEVKSKTCWGIFNHLFVRKAIDMAFDLNCSEREACSNLLVTCTEEFGFVGNDFGYAFDFLIWVSLHFTTNN